MNYISQSKFSDNVVELLSRFSEKWLLWQVHIALARITQSILAVAIRCSAGSTDGNREGSPERSDPGGVLRQSWEFGAHTKRFISIWISRVHGIILTICRQMNCAQQNIQYGVSVKRKFWLAHESSFYSRYELSERPWIQGYLISQANAQLSMWLSPDWFESSKTAHVFWLV